MSLDRRLRAEEVVPAAVAASEEYLQTLRARAMLRVQQEERDAGYGVTAEASLPSRRGVVQRMALLAAGAVPVVGALLRAKNAFAAHVVAPRACAPQYGAPWIEPPTIPYVSADRLNAAHSAVELANGDRWKRADIVFFPPGGHTGWMGEGIAHARTAQFEPHGGGDAYSLMVFGDDTAKRAYLMHGGGTVYLAAKDGARSYVWNDGVLTGMRALGSVPWKDDASLDLAIASLAGKVDSKLVEDRRYAMPSINLRRPELAGIFPARSSISGGSFTDGKLEFSVSRWDAQTQKGRWVQFTVDVEANRLVKILLNNKEIPL